MSKFFRIILMSALTTSAVICNAWIPEAVEVQDAALSDASKIFMAGEILKNGEFDGRGLHSVDGYRVSGDKVSISLIPNEIAQIDGIPAGDACVEVDLKAEVFVTKRGSCFQ